MVGPLGIEDPGFIDSKLLILLIIKSYQNEIATEKILLELDK
jgi:hypothetical protein